MTRKGPKAVPAIRPHLRWLNTGIVGLMMVCVAATVRQAGARVSSGWNSDYVLLLSFGVALEAMASTRRASRYELFSRGWFKIRIPEWIVILLSAKIAAYAVHGTDQFVADLARWREDFVGGFFGGEYLIACLVLFLIWIVSARLADSLTTLESGDSTVLQNREGIYDDYQRARHNLYDDIFITGGGMLFLLSVLRLEQLSVDSVAVPPVDVSGALLYFILGLVLLSYSQFVALRGRWRIEGLRVEQALARRWLVYSAGLLAVLVALALILPNQYSIGLFDTLGILLATLINILLGLVGLLVFLVTLLLALLNSLFTGRPIDLFASRAPQPFVLPPQSAGKSIPFSEVINSVVFWAFFLTVIVYAVRHYLQQHQEVNTRFKRIPFVAQLAQVWRWLWTLVIGARQQATNAIAVRLRRWRDASRPGSVDRAGRFVNVRRLAPRERVLFYYLTAVRRAGEHGWPRKPFQTPNEYAAHLRDELPEVADEVTRITDGFVEARYSRHEISDDQAGRVRRGWERIRRALRVKRERKP